MRPILRSPAPILILIVAIPVIAIAYATAADPNIQTYQRWFDLGWRICAVAAALLLVLALQQQASMKGKPLDEAAINRSKTTILLVGAVGVAAYGLGSAASTPALVLLVAAAAVVWILVWSVPGLRRTHVLTAFVIDCSPDVVFPFISDLRNLPKWWTGIESVEMLTTQPIGSGSRFREWVKLEDGTQFSGVDEIVDFEPNRRFSNRLITGLNPNRDEFTFEPVGNGTRVTHRFDYELSFVSTALGSRFWQRVVRQTMTARRRAAEVKIKQILESAPLQQSH